MSSAASGRVAFATARLALLAAAVVVASGCGGGGGGGEGSALVGAKGRIAYVSQRSGSAEIYVANADGSSERRLTPGTEPAWSPDGKSVAFTGDDVRVVRAGGGGSRRVVRGEQPAWSPDGKRLAFVDYDDLTPLLRIVDVDGSGLRTLLRGAPFVGEPAWSPDGRRLAFVGWDGDNEIYAVDADGSGVTNLTDDEFQELEPAWSPDGRKVAFRTSRPETDGEDAIYVMNPDGTDEAPVADEHVEGERDPAWSPDGTRIAFVSFRDEDYEIYVMRADGTGQARLTKSDEEDSHPSWGR